MKVQGACHCGTLVYEAEIDPEKVVICHCTDCQAMSASAYRTSVPVPEADVRMTAGEPTFYLKKADSGRTRVQAFCPTCGTQIYSGDVGEGERMLSLRIGALRQRRDLPPKRQIWCDSALPWTQNLTALPRAPRE